MTMKQLNETVAGTATDIREKAAEIRQQGFCILPNHFSQKAIEACAHAFRPILLDYAQTHSETPNRGGVPIGTIFRCPFNPPSSTPNSFSIQPSWPFMKPSWAKIPVSTSSPVTLRSTYRFTRTSTPMSRRYFTKHPK